MTETKPWQFDVEMAKEKHDSKNKAFQVGLWAGTAAAVSLTLAVEAALIWLVLVFLIKTSIGFLKVLGFVLLFEVALARLKAKQ